MSSIWIRLREPGSIRAIATAIATIAALFVAPDRAAEIAGVGGAVVTMIAVLTPER